MCEVCKTDQKCAHPWAQCMASRGEHCAACGHTSWAPRRPPDPTPSTSSTEEPEGAASRGRLVPFGQIRASRLPPGDCLAYAVQLAPVVVVPAMMPSTAADRHGHKDAGLGHKGNRQEQHRDPQIAHGATSYRMGRIARFEHSAAEQIPVPPPAASA